jgi:DNA repair exonuclease SbcCD ATPase subunit
MIIKNIELTNFGIHRSLKADTNDSVVGLIGPNGYGKSTVLVAIKYLFTGELEDTASTYITTGESKATVSCEFRLHGKDGRITRSILGRTSSRELVFDGQTYTSDKAVTDKLAEMFTVDKKAVSSAVFISQGELATLLFGKDSERLDMFTKVTNIGFMDKHASILESKIKSLTDGTQDLSSLKDAAQQQTESSTVEVASIESKLLPYIGSTEKLKQANIARDAMARRDAVIRSISDTTTRIQELKAGLMTDADIAAIEALKVKYKSDIVEASATLKNISEVKANLLKLNQAKAQLETKRQELKTLEGIVSKQGNPDDYQKLIEGYKSDMQKLQTYGELQVELESLNKKMQFESNSLEANTTDLQRIEAQHNLQDLKDEKAILTADLQQSENWYNVQKELFACGVCSENASCKKCGLKLASGTTITQDSLDELAKLVAGKRTRLTEIVSIITTNESSIAKFTAKINAHKEAMKNIAMNLMAVQTRISSLMPMPVNTEKAVVESMYWGALKVYEEIKASREAYNKLNLEVNSLEAYAKGCEFNYDPTQSLDDSSVASKLTETHTLLRDVDSKITLQASKLAQVNAESGTLERQNADIKAIDAIVSTVVEVDPRTLSELEVNARFESELSGNLQQAKKVLEESKARLKDIESRIEANRKRMELAENLKRARNLFKKDGLPRAYIDAKFRRIAEMVEHNLVKTNCPFTVKPDPDRPISFLFECYDTHSGVLPQSKMSGGQKVRLSVAFLMAVQQLLIPEFGFLVLDEPSQNLDDEAVNSTADLLTNMASILKADDNQIFVVDHSEELKRAFGKTLVFNKK